MTDIVERFLRYVKTDTQSEDEQEQFPSTEKQKNLAVILKGELEKMGASDVRMDEYGYVYARIPSNMKADTEKKIPAVGFISHMDTAPSCSGTDVQPQIHRNYDGGTLILNKEKQIQLTPEQFPELLLHKGKDKISITIISIVIISIVPSKK